MWDAVWEFIKGFFRSQVVLIIASLIAFVFIFLALLVFVNRHRVKEEDESER